MANINLLPGIVVQKLEEAGVPQDSLIFYQNNRWVYQIGQKIPVNSQLSCQPLESLGPFGIHEVDIDFELSPLTFQYTITSIKQRELASNKQVTGIYAPITPITLGGFARDSANIPNNATHFCWLYPPTSLNDADDIDLNSYEENLLKIGGFAYFKIDQNSDAKPELVRVNCLIVSATNGLTFEGPYPWRKEFTEQLWTQNRFQPVTLSSLRDNDARYFAFINPCEHFSNDNNQSSWTPSSNGAFVYLFNRDHSAHTFDCYFSVADNCLGDPPSDP